MSAAIDTIQRNQAINQTLAQWRDQQEIICLLEAAVDANNKADRVRSDPTK